METRMINLSIPKPLLRRLDLQAKKEIKTRSEALREAIRLYVREESLLDEIFEFGQKTAKKLKVKEKDLEKTVDDYRQGK